MADPMMPGSTDLNTLIKALHGAGSVVAPNITSLMSGQKDPTPYPSMNPTAGGKIPGTDDPRMWGAAVEGMGLGGAALGGGGAVGGALGRAGSEAIPAAETAMGGAGRGNQIIRNLLMGGAQDMGPSPAQAGTHLLPDEKRAIEVEKQKSQNAASIAAQQQQSQADQEIAKQKAMGEMSLQQKAQEAQQQQQQKAQEAQFQQQQEQEATKRQANMPFRERHPDVAASLPMAGDAAAIGIPMMASLLSKGRLGKMAGSWENAVGKGSAWADANQNTKKLPAALAKELQAHMEGWGKASDPVGTVGHITGAMAPLEASMFPMEMDAMTLPPDAPDKWALMHQSPEELAMRAGSAGLQGLPFATAGKLLGKHAVTPAVPLAQTQGLLARASKAKPR